MRMIETVSSIGPGERVLIGGDLNGHVGAESSGYEDVHGGVRFWRQKCGRRDDFGIC